MTPAERLRAADTLLRGSAVGVPPEIAGPLGDWLRREATAHDREAYRYGGEPPPEPLHVADAILALASAKHRPTFVDTKWLGMHKQRVTGIGVRCSCGWMLGDGYNRLGAERAWDNHLLEAEGIERMHS